MIICSIMTITMTTIMTTTTVTWRHQQTNDATMSGNVCPHRSFILDSLARLWSTVVTLHFGLSPSASLLFPFHVCPFPPADKEFVENPDNRNNEEASCLWSWKDSRSIIEGTFPLSSKTHDKRKLFYLANSGEITISRELTPNFSR